MVFVAQVGRWVRGLKKKGNQTDESNDSAQSTDIVDETADGEWLLPPTSSNPYYTLTYFYHRRRAATVVYRKRSLFQSAATGQVQPSSSPTPPVTETRRGVAVVSITLSVITSRTTVCDVIMSPLSSLGISRR